MIKRKCLPVFIFYGWCMIWIGYSVSAFGGNKKLDGGEGQGNHIDRVLHDLKALNERAILLATDNPDSALFMSETVIRQGKSYLNKIDTNDTFLLNSTRRELMKAYGQIGAIQGERGNYPEMAEYYLNALSLAEDLQDSIAIIDISGDIGTAYRYSHDRKRAIVYFRDALDKSIQIGSIALQAKNYNLLGGAYIDLNVNDSALYYMSKSLQLKLILQDISGISKCYNNLGVIFSNQNERDSARHYFLKALDFMRQINEPFGMGIIYNGVGDEFRQIKKWDMASLYLDSSMAIADKLKSKYLQQMNYFSYSELYAAKGDYKNAFHFYKLHRIITDSIRSETDVQAIADLKNRYEKTRKDMSILQLSNQNALIGEELKRQKLIRNMLIAGVLILLIFIFTIIQLNKRKLKAEKKQKEAELIRQSAITEMKVLRSQMNTHFIFNTLQSIYEYMMQNQTSKAGEYLLKFSKLIRMILNLSRQSLVPLDEELRSLELYIELENIRMNHPFSYSIETPRDSNEPEIKLPPLLLQPLVENSIKHGLSGDIAGGILLIKVYISGDYLHCLVENKGKKLNGTTFTPEHGGRSLGLKILKERLDILSTDKTLKATVSTGQIQAGDNNEYSYRSELIIPVTLLKEAEINMDLNTQSS